MSAAAPWVAALAALFLWWFSTGAILVLVRHAGGRGALAALASLPLLGLGLWGVRASLDMAGPGGAYLGFVAALAVWGWIELAFLTGVVTGPNPHPCPGDAPQWERFIRAWGTIAYHEMTLVAALAALAAMSAGAENQVALWTYLVLFFARVSAKLNLFFGVPRINTEFLPEALAHLPSHFRIARLNWLFPVSVTALSFACACWIERLLAATAPGAATGFALLAAITALALIEHWLMVVPLPDAKLWRWMLPAPKQDKTAREGSNGF